MEKELRLIGEKIRQIRKTKKFTQEKLAELSNLDPTYISEVENGKANYTISTLFAICNALGVKANELIEAAYSQEVQHSFQMRFSKLSNLLKKRDETTQQKILTIFELLLKD